MTAFAGKIRDSFSDLWLEIELFFGKLFKKKPKETPVVTPVAKPENKDIPTPATPVAVTEDKGKEKEKEARKTEKLSFGMRMLSMSHKERLFFYDQMSTLIGSGVTLIDSLSLVLAQTKQKGIKKLYNEMIHDINTGMSLADSMYRFPHIFPKMQSALVEAAEKSGNLKTVLAELVEEMEASQDFKRKIMGAMFYPIILIILALAMVVGMMTFVIPKISVMYKDANLELNQLTQTVINISDYIRANWPMLTIAVVGSIFILWLFFSKLKAGKLFWEKIISGIPVAGKISKEKNLMMISSNMAMLMKSGVLISDAFAITENTVGNLHYKRALAEVRKGIIMGKEVSEMMGLEDIKTQKFKKHKLFPLQMAQLMHIGESTGKISEMLLKLKSNYRKSIDYKLKNISTMIEPIMIFIVAALIGTILLAVVIPIFNLGQTIS